MESKEVNKLEGVDTVIDEFVMPDNLVRWAEGGFFNKNGNFERIKGKRLFENSTAIGPVLTIAEISFERQRCIVFHTSAFYQVTTSMAAVGTTDSSAVPFTPFM